MPYTIPSYTVSPGSVYQPYKGLPSIVKTDGRAAYFTRGGSIASGRVLDQLPSNNGTRRTGEEGRCVDLNGTNQAVRVADNTALDITDNLTVCFWAKNDNATTAGEYILTKYDTGANKREWALGYNSSQKLLANIGSSDGSAFTSQTSDAAVSIDSWHHVAFTFYGGVVVLYVNGSVVASTASAAHPTSLNNEDADLIIGAGLNNNAILASWDGQIFDARIYAGDSTVLTAAQIAAIYADGANNIQFDGQTLAAHYKLDEQSGTTCYDSSGNGNNGTIENAVSNWSVTQDVLSFQNQVGYNVGRNAISNSEKFSSWSSSGGAAVNSGVTAGPDGLRLADRLNTASIPAYIYNSYYASGIVSGSKFTASVWVKADGNAGDKVRLRLSRAGSGTFEESSVQITLTDTWTRHKISHTYANAQEAVRYDIGVLSVLDTAASCLIFGAQLDYGDTETEYQRTFSSGNYGSLLPRDESDPTNDVLGNPLTNIGRRPNDGKLNGSNCLTADGTLYIAAAHLAGTETVVSSGGTSTPSISAGRIDFTAGTCWDLTLSDGTHYPLSEGWGVNIGSSTSDNDGTLTNAVLANAWGATQNEYHFNILNGFSLYEHATTAAIRWPYKNNAVKTLTPPTGYSKTSDNPAGDYHNNAETTIDFNPDSTPEMGATQLGITVPSAHGFGDTLAASTQIFSRQRTLTEDRIITMTEAQSGSALATIQKYTQP